MANDNKVDPSILSKCNVLQRAPHDGQGITFTYVRYLPAQDVFRELRKSLILLRHKKKRKIKLQFWRFLQKILFNPSAECVRDKVRMLSTKAACDVIIFKLEGTRNCPGFSPFRRLCVNTCIAMGWVRISNIHSICFYQWGTHERMVGWDSSML